MKPVKLSKTMRLCLFHVWDEGWSENDWAYVEGSHDYIPHWRTLEALVKREVLRFVTEKRRWELTPLGTWLLLRQIRRQVEQLETDIRNPADGREGLLQLWRDRHSVKYYKNICEGLTKELLEHKLNKEN